MSMRIDISTVTVVQQGVDGDRRVLWRCECVVQSRQCVTVIKVLPKRNGTDAVSGRIIVAVAESKFTRAV